MLFENIISSRISEFFPSVFGKTIDAAQLTFQDTRKDFTGDLTLVVFNLAKITGQSPEATANLIGSNLMAYNEVVSGFNVVKGFLNIEVQNTLWLSQLSNSIKQPLKADGNQNSGSTGKPVLVEYSSPNTNKPLHLGHMRNILLGYSLAEILKFNGVNVHKVNIINDRGIHICKSMLAWQKFGNGETPASSGIKGDHLVGKYYVEFDKHYKDQISDLKASGMEEKDAEKKAPLMIEAQQMLNKWEQNDSETLALWEKMNNWVYEGFDVTYKRLGVDFDQIYYESKTYLLGKEIIEEGLAKGILIKKPDGSVWIDLREEGLDEKVLLRSDGTSVYMTQDIGTAVKRYEEYQFDKMIYVVGNEQDYHFKVLFQALKKLGYEWSDKLYHLSYNMVDLPSGKMKSREGTVVDADELIDEMVGEAKKLSIELGKLDDFESAEANELFSMLGLGALKYYILKVDPEKRMLFNPNESIDFNGNTGPFIQYTHARIKSVLRKAQGISAFSNALDLDVTAYKNMIPKEKELLKTILKADEIIVEAANRFSPAIIANYTYELAKTYNQFYHEHPIVDIEHPETSAFRLRLSNNCADILKVTMKLLGIAVPEKM